MGKLLSNFRTTILLSLVLAGVMILAFGQVSGGFGEVFWQAALRWVWAAVWEVTRCRAWPLNLGDVAGWHPDPCWAKRLVVAILDRQDPCPNGHH